MTALWRIGEILIQRKLINWEQLQECLLEQKKTHEFIGEILVRKKMVPKSLLYRALAEQFNMRFVDLKRMRINPLAVEKIPASLARKYQIMPFELTDNTLVIGITDPLRAWPEEEIRRLAKVNELIKALCLPDDVDQCIREHYLEKGANV